MRILFEGSPVKIDPEDEATLEDTTGLAAARPWRVGKDPNGNPRVMRSVQVTEGGPWRTQQAQRLLYPQGRPRPRDGNWLDLRRTNWIPNKVIPKAVPKVVSDSQPLKLLPDFDKLLAQALEAFGTDERYACMMSYDALALPYPEWLTDATFDIEDYIIELVTRNPGIERTRLRAKVIWQLRKQRDDDSTVGLGEPVTLALDALVERCVLVPNRSFSQGNRRQKQEPINYRLHPDHSTKLELRPEPVLASAAR